MELEERIARLDWPAIEAGLNASGCAPKGRLLSKAECEGLAAG